MSPPLPPRAQSAVARRPFGTDAARDGRSNCDDDDFILSRAKRCEENGQRVMILTNDHYRDWVDNTSRGHPWFDAAWRDANVCKFTWDHQVLQPQSKHTT